MLCSVCGTDFDNWGNQKFCSERCRVKNHLKSTRKNREERTVICAYCGEIFKTWSTIKKFCNYDCSSAYHSSKRSR